MKFHLSLIFTLLLSLIPTQAIAADEIVEKTECVQAFGYADLDALKADLLLRAKRLAVDDLFGFLIVSSTAVQQSVLTDDNISTSSVAYMQVKGIPNYIHGDNLAEVCVTIQAYVTKKDRMKFDPITIMADECVTQPDLSPRKLEDLGEEQTIIKALVKMNAKLQDQDRANLLKLVHNVKFAPDSGIIPNTDTYCGNVTVEVVPIEIEAFLLAESSILTGSSTLTPTVTGQLSDQQTVTSTQETKVVRLEVNGIEASYEEGGTFSSRGAYDKNEETYWISRFEAKGAWIEMRFRVPKVISRIGVYREPKQTAWGQLREATLIFSDGSTQDIQLQGYDGWEYIDISPVKTTSVRLEVKTIYPKSPGMFIYEIELWGAD